MSFLSNSCQFIQARISFYIPEDYAKASALSFAYSFTATLLLVRSSAKSSVTAGVLGTLATTIYAVSIALLQKTVTTLSTKFNKPVHPLGTEGRYSCLLLTILFTLKLSKAVGYPANNNGTAVLSFPFYLKSMLSGSTPITGIVVP